uniref:Periaxin n=1 Tax=Geotrypetes seraphini TaxID=260995 RepID=A0A6P8RWU5_GEOSA|nr:periaxin [Geotrypetes seraphini]XP_033810117.1 periaxin [Geotrypetes seraphini]XP_033810118.1 periaxin [Geotrypetes seraphini]
MMETLVKISEEEKKKSEMVEVIVETEAEAGVSGINVEGGGRKGIFIKDLSKDSLAAKSLSLQEGDQLLSARVYFENVKCEDALKLLQCAEAHKVSFCLKRTVQASDISVSPRVGGLELKGPKAKMPKMTIQSLKPSKKKKKEVKSPGDISREGSLESRKDLNVEISPGMMEIPPVDVEFALPWFPKLMKAKGEAGAGATVEGLDPSVGLSATEKKHMKLKLPRLRVKEAAAVKSLNVEVHEPEVSLEIQVPEAEEKAKIKTPKFGIFPRTKKPKVDVTLAKRKVEVSVPEMGTEIQKDVKFKPPEVEFDLSLTTRKAEGTVLKPRMDGKNMADVEVEGPESMLKIDQIPKVHISVPKIEREISRSEIDSNIEVGGFEGLPKPGIQLPSVDINIPKVDVDISLPKIEGDTEMKAGLEAPGTSLKGEGFKMQMPTLDISAQVPDINLDVPRPQALGEVKMESPEVKLKFPKMKTPDIGISLSKDKAEGEMDVSLDQAKLHVKSPDGKYKPGLKMPSFDIAIPSADFDITIPKGQMEVSSQISKDIVGYPPEANIEIPDVTMKMPKIKLPKFGTKDKENNVNAHLVPPKVQGQVKVSQTEIKDDKIESPGVKAKGPKIKLPSFGILLTKDKHDVPIPKVDVKTEKPEVSTKGELQFPEVKMPSIDISIPKVPDVQLPQAKLEISGPAFAGDIKTPETGGVESSDYKLKMPKVSLPEVDISVKAEKPDLDIQVSPPKAALSKLEMELKGGDLDLKDGKISVPKIALSLPGRKPVEPDVSQKTELEISVGKPAVDIRIPKGDDNVKGPKLELESSETKLNLPSAKMPSLEVGLPKVEVDLNLPKTEVFASGFEEPNVKLKMPKIPLPKLSGKDMDFEIDVPSPRLMVDVKAPHIETHLTRTDAQAPDMTGKGLKISMPKPVSTVGKKELIGKEERTISGQELKAKINNVITQVELETPNLASSLEAKLPTVQLPSVDISAPKVPDVDIDAHAPLDSGKLSGKVDAEAKWKTPKFLLPKFGISGPKTKNLDVEVEADGADSVIKGPKLKMSKFGISLPKTKHETDSEGAVVISRPEVKAPKGKIEVAGSPIEIDLSNAKAALPAVILPKVDISAPKAEIDISQPINKIDISAVGDKDLPRAVIDKPSEINIEIPDVKLKMPKFSLLKSGTRSKENELAIDLEGLHTSARVTSPKKGGSLEADSRDLDVSLIDGKAKGKEVKMKMPKFKMPSFGMSKKDVDVSVRRVDTGISVPSIDVTVNREGAEVSSESPDRKLKTPFIKMPKFKMPSTKDKVYEDGVKVDADVDIREPDVQIKIPTVALPKFGMKDAHIDLGTDISMPKIEGELEKFQGKIKAGKVDIPALEVSAPHTVPSLQISVPSVQLGSAVSVPKSIADMSAGDIKGTGGDLQIPHMPSINLSSPRVELDISLPQTKADTLMEVGVGDKIDSSRSDMKLKMPEVELPKLKLKDQEAKMEVSGKKIKTPAIAMTGPKISLDIKGPLYGTEDTDEALKGAKIRMPKLDISLPIVRTSDSDLPFAEREIGLEGLGFKGEDMEGKFSLPSVQLPKISTPKLRAPDIELDISLGTEKDLSLDTDYGRPDVHMKTQQIEKSGPNIEEPELELKMHKIKMPKFGLPSLQVKGVEGDINLDLPKTERMDIKPSKVEGRFEAPSAEGGIKGIKIKMPKLQIGSSKETVEEDVLLGMEDEANVLVAADAKPHEVEAHGESRKFKIKMPTFGISRGSVDARDVEAGMQPLRSITGESEFKLKLPQISVPDIGFSAGEGGEDEVALERGQAKTSYGSDAKFRGLKVELEKSASGEDLGVAVGVPDAKLKMPKIKMPAIGISGWKDKTDDDMGVALESKKEFHMENLKVKAPLLKMPDIEISAPKMKTEAEYSVDGAKFDARVSSESEISKVSGKVKVAGKDHQEEVPSDEMGQQYKVKMPNLEIDLPEVDLDISSPVFSVETKVAEATAHGDHVLKTVSAKHEIKNQEGKSKVPKVKKAMFVLAKPKKKGAEASSGLLEPDGDVAAGSVEGEVHISEVKIKMPKIKMKPSFGISRSKPKGTHVNGEYDVSLKEEGNAELSPDDKGKVSKLKLPKLGFSTSKPESLDINVNGTGPSSSSTQINGEHDSSFQDSKVKLGKLKLPNVEFSSPYKTKEADTEMSQNLVKTEDEAFFSTFKAPKFKAPKLTFSNFKKKAEKGEELDASGNLVASSARTEMASLEKGGDGDNKIGRPKISLGFIPSKSKGEYTVDNSGIPLESGTSREVTKVKGVGQSEIEGKDKSAKFKLPKLSLSPKSKGKLEIRNEQEEQEKRGCFQELEEERPSGGFMISVPQVGFTTEEHAFEEQITEKEGGSILRIYKTETVTEKSTSI